MQFTDFFACWLRSRMSFRRSIWYFLALERHSMKHVQNCFGLVETRVIQIASSWACVSFSSSHFWTSLCFQLAHLLTLTQPGCFHRSYATTCGQVVSLETFADLCHSTFTASATPGYCLAHDRQGRLNFPARKAWTLLVLTQCQSIKGPPFPRLDFILSHIGCSVTRLQHWYWSSNLTN